MKKILILAFVSAALSAITVSDARAEDVVFSSHPEKLDSWTPQGPIYVLSPRYFYVEAPNCDEALKKFDPYTKDDWKQYPAVFFVGGIKCLLVQTTPMAFLVDMFYSATPNDPKAPEGADQLQKYIARRTGEVWFEKKISFQKVSQYAVPITLRFEGKEPQSLKPYSRIKWYGLVPEETVGNVYHWLAQVTQIRDYDSLMGKLKDIFGANIRDDVAPFKGEIYGVDFFLTKPVFFLDDGTIRESLWGRHYGRSCHPHACF